MGHLSYFKFHWMISCCYTVSTFNLRPFRCGFWFQYLNNINNHIHNGKGGREPNTVVPISVNFILPFQGKPSFFCDNECIISLIFAEIVENLLSFPTELIIALLLICQKNTYNSNQDVEKVKNLPHGTFLISLVLSSCHFKQLPHSYHSIRGVQWVELYPNPPKC